VVKNAITGGAIATAAEFLTHLTSWLYYIIFMTHRDPPLATSSDPLHPLFFLAWWWRTILY
jgi:hypothetical protein